MEPYNLGQRVKFEGKICTIINVDKSLGTYEVYAVKSESGPTVRQAFRYQLQPDCFDSDEDKLLLQVQCDEDVVSKTVGRFAKVDDKSLDEIELSRNEKNTQKQTEWGVRVLREWLVASGMSTEFETLSPDQLNGVLRQFYAEARTKKGDVYSKAALVGIRAGLNRHLTAPPHSRQISLVHDRAFTSSNHVFTGVIKAHKRMGKDVTKHKEPISEGDLAKLYKRDTLSTSNPTSLLRKVWFDIEYHFGRRGREGLRELRHNSFVFEKDDSDLEFVSMAYNEVDKTHHGVDGREREKNVRMYASNDEKCPVKSLRLYLAKRNPKNESFFQRPLKNPSYDDTVWYYNMPLGARTLGDMMSEISKHAGLSRRYTNHCLRATSATVLSQAGVGIHGIMSVTGHHNEPSVRSYVSQPSVQQRRSFSSILYQAVLGDTNSNQVVSKLSATHTEVEMSTSSSTVSMLPLPALFQNSTITGGNINISFNGVGK